jgi:hypothetical protein
MPSRRRNLLSGPVDVNLHAPPDVTWRSLGEPSKDRGADHGDVVVRSVARLAGPPSMDGLPLEAPSIAIEIKRVPSPSCGLARILRPGGRA